MPLVFIAGGVRSGKSRFALTRAERVGERRVFVATGRALDDEMRARIAGHRSERSDRYRTVEAPHEVAAAVTSVAADAIVIDCVTLWLSNLLLRGDSDAAIESAILELAAVAVEATATVIVVSNEVGLGIVPETALGRRFRDLAGRAHQALAARSEELYFAAMGVILRLRPGPVEVLSSAAPTRDADAAGS